MTCSWRRMRVSSFQKSAVAAVAAQSDRGGK